MLAMIIGGFFKISIYFYIAVAGTASLFRITEPARLVYPMGLVILFLSITVASNYSEHSHEGVVLVPIVLHLPFQVVIPLVLLMVAFIKNRRHSGVKVKGENEHQG